MRISPWAQEELGSADFGDQRLDERSAVLLSVLGNHPHLSIPAACSSRAEMAAAYRFFDNDKVTFEKVLEPHVHQTLQRLKRRPVVLLVQDTSEIVLDRPRLQVQGAGMLDGSRRGVLLHAMHAYTPEGVPLGTLSARCLNRAESVSHAPEPQKQHRRKHTPIEDKESMRWLEGLRQARRIAGELPEVQCICVCDSEADIYELLAEPRSEQADKSPAHWLIRAGHDRSLEGSTPEGAGRLREALLTTPVLYEARLQIRGREAKTPMEDRARKQSRQSRQATVQVRASKVTLRPPWRSDRQLPPVEVHAVLVAEAEPPEGEPAVEWLLITTLPIGTLEQVRQVVAYYCVRWNIEILFRTLKTGCRIEHRRFEHVERMLPCLMMYLIVAWRTMLVCRLGRECPEEDCQLLFEASEWKAVWAAVHRRKPPRRRPKLLEMVHLIARLGGYAEGSTLEPGPQAIWIGLQRMHDLALAWDAFGPDSKINGP